MVRQCNPIAPSLERADTAPGDDQDLPAIRRYSREVDARPSLFSRVSFLEALGTVGLARRRATRRRGSSPGYRRRLPQAKRGATRGMFATAHWQDDQSLLFRDGLG